MTEQQPVPLTKTDPVPATVPAPAPVSAAELRASDADRDRIADILREALAEGRLDPEEHAERIDAVYRAKTVGELDPLVRDLPAAAGTGRAAAPVPVPGDLGPRGPRALPASDNLTAVFGGAVRRGRWRVRRTTHAFALFGGVEIDLTEALFEHREVVINVCAIFGGVEIKVPENVTVSGNGGGIFGGFDIKTYEAPDPEAPAVVVRGFAFFGGAEVKRKRGKRLKNLRSY
ncbi:MULTISPECIES: DUF1707 domain-containing protein [unclassified Streptomyces]|uniref:DUF1707 SHOCT-like domain-containing protein n=1 Tax=unclassified Streptomyces TaxID=2593676 RepID=UPI00336A3E72